MNDPHITPRPPEVDLLLACARWPQNAADRAFIRAQSATPLDWPRFLLLAQHHRLAPLVAHNLQASIAAGTTPGQVATLDQLRQAASDNTYRALRSLAELRRVVHEFESHNIPVRVLKGLPLAQSVFGNFSLRSTGDLDLLIDEDSIREADRLLCASGYRGLFQLDRFTPKRLAFYRAHWKDIAYYHPDTGFEVDLHWRCFRNSAMPGNALCSTSTETVSFGNFQVTTLPRMETLLYLCVHGTLDGWLYLKSLADIAAQVRTMDPTQLEALAKLATSYAILPELTAALILCRRYFGMESWSQGLLPDTDPTVRHILRFADQSLEQGEFLANRDAISAISMMAFDIGLRRNFRYRRELLLRVLFRARMWETIRLPDSLFGLYPLLSPFEWIIFRLRQGRPKSPSGTALSI